MSKPHSRAPGDPFDRLRVAPSGSRGDGTAALVLGIVLTVVGGGALIQHATGVEVWNHLWRLWPVLLIIMGVKVLVDHYGARRSGKENRP